MPSIGTHVAHPVWALGFSHLWWADGPRFNRLNYRPGAAIAFWPDEINNLHSQQITAAKRPTYQPADAAIGNRACVVMDGTDDWLMTVTGASIAVPYAAVFVVQLSSVGAQKYIADGPNDAGSGNRFLIQGSPSASSAWGLYNGTQRTGGTASTGLHGIRAHNASGNDTLTVDGATIISGSNAGDLNFNGFTLGGSTGAVMNGRLSLVGVYPGDVTAAAGWTMFVDWVKAYYGATLS